MDAAEALRIAILFVGWPGMALVVGFVLWQGWQFHLKVKGSPFGRLILLMVTAWTMSIGFLAFLATLYLQGSPESGGAVSAAFLVFWAANMALVVWLMHRWGAEAVHINLYYAELAKMDQTKTNLINTVAHELNTPLTPITLKMGLLRDGRFGPVSKEQSQVLDSMDRNLGKLSALVDQVVLATQIQTGQLHPIPIPTPLSYSLDSANAPFEPEAAKDSHPFSVHADGDVVVPMDRSRMDRVLNALLGNAFRFSKQGAPVEVTATTAGDRLLMKVSDSGIGFTAEQAKLLFEPMRTPHDPHQNTQVGAGLSLFVAKGIVEAHGGHMWASSPGPGKGSTFSFELPLVSGLAQAMPFGAPVPIIQPAP